MAVVLKQVMPTGVSLDLIDAVTAEMGVEAEPPAGMIVHTHFERDGRVHILDVWESEEAHESFVTARLQPAMGKVAAEAGFDLTAAGPPDTTLTTVHRMVRGT